MPGKIERSIEELYRDDPERADAVAFGRRAGVDRRGFLGGAGLAAIRTLLAHGKIARHESVVLFNTGSGYKYLEAWQAALAD